MQSRTLLLTHVALVCLSLATSALALAPLCRDVNMKITITDIGVGQHIDDSQFVYASQDSQVILARTGTGDVWLSNNEGESWTKITVPSKMPEIDQTRQKVWQVVVGAEVKGVAMIYLLGYTGANIEPSGFQRLWTSDDNGATFNLRRIPTDIRRIVPHSQFLRQALFLRGTTREVYLTKDAAATFPKSIFTGILNLNINWGPANQHPNRIYAILGDSPNAFWTHRLVYSDDFFETDPVTVIEHVYFYTQRNDDDFIAIQFEDPTNLMKTRMVLSKDGGKNWHVSTFYDEGGIEVEEYGYIIYDTDPDAVFTGIMRPPRFGNPTKYDDLFKSEGFDKHAILSRKFQYFYDFKKLESVDGVYVSNFYDVHPNDTLLGPDSTTDIRTMITFNKGSDWQPLAAPKKKYNGELYNCKLEDGCSLHLHGYSTASAFTWLYSVPNAVGLMLGTGNVGKELLSGRDEARTYLSRDAGVTWQEVSAGRRIPEYGDHGGVIVLVDPTGSERSTIEYTLDEGETWQKCIFSSERNIALRNIRISPDFNTHQFNAYGSEPESQMSTIVNIDFADLMPKCTAADYEEWSPADAHGNCIMGQKTFYHRRKPSSKCWNGEEFDRIIRTEKCACAANDYECSFCFRRDYFTGACVFDCFHDLGAISALPMHLADQCQAGEALYPINGGVQKIAGDHCDESLPGTQAIPKGYVHCDLENRITAPEANSHKDPALLIAAIIVLVAGVLVAIFLFLWAKNDRQWFRKPEPVGFQQLGVETLYEEESDDDADDADQRGNDNLEAPSFTSNNDNNNNYNNNNGGGSDPTLQSAEEDFFAAQPSELIVENEDNDEPKVGNLI